MTPYEIVIQFKLFVGEKIYKWGMDYNTKDPYDQGFLDGLDEAQTLLEEFLEEETFNETGTAEAN